MTSFVPARQYLVVHSISVSNIEGIGNRMTRPSFPRAPVVSALGVLTPPLPSLCRYMLGLSVLPAVLQFVGFLFLPESPRWLIQRGLTQKARRVLSQIRGNQNIDEEYDSIKNSIDEEEDGRGGNGGLNRGRNGAREQLRRFFMRYFYGDSICTGIRAVCVYYLFISRFGLSVTFGVVQQSSRGISFRVEVTAAGQRSLRPRQQMTCLKGLAFPRYSCHQHLTAESRPPPPRAPRRQRRPPLHSL